MIPYILHITILISVFFLFYKAFLESETFFSLNRWVLLAGIILSFSLPLIDVPQHWSLRFSLDLSTYFEKNPEKSIAIQENPKSEDNTLIIANKSKKQKEQEIESNTSVLLRQSYISPTQLVWYIYYVGSGIFILNLLIQVGILFYRIIKMRQFPDGSYRIIELEEDKAPYSFINYIFINPSKYDWHTYEQILQHEKFHISQKHSIDLFLAEILVAVQWYNPFAWWYRKVLENNLEFLTDSLMLSKGYDRQAYQMSLVKVSVPDYPLSLTNNYNQSFLKRRITMMNAKKSSFQSLWKYFFLVSVLGLSVLIFNDVHRPALAQIIKGNKEKSKYEFKELPPLPPLPNNPNVDIDINPVLAPTPDIDVNVNMDVNVEPNFSQKRMGTFIRGNNKSFTFNKSGVWRAWIEENTVCFNFDLSNRSEGNVWMQSGCFKKSELGTLPINQEGKFQIKRETGQIDFTGKFENKEGLGRFTFTSNENFKKYLTQEGFNDIDDAMMFHLFIADLDKAYIAFLKKQGYGSITTKELRKLAIHDLSQKQIENYLNIFNESLTINEIIKLGIHDVDTEYIQSLASVGYKNLTASQAIKASIHDLDADLVKAFNKKGLQSIPFNEVIKLSIHDVDVAFIESLEKLGYNNLSAGQLVKAKIHDVDPANIKALKEMGYDLSIGEVIKINIHDINPAYIKELKGMGFNNLSLDEITKAKIHDVSPAYVKELKAAGLNNLSLREITNLSIHDVDTRLIKMLQSLGYSNLSADQIKRAAIHDVDKRLVNALKEQGYTNIPFDQLVKAATHDVSGRYIKGLADLGFKNVPLDQIINCSIHDVTPEFIKRMREKGFKDLSLEKYKKLKIHGFDKD